MKLEPKSNLEKLSGIQASDQIGELLVSDLPASADYYVRVLGFEWLRQGDEALELASGEMRLILKKAPEPGFERSSIMLFCTDAAFLHDRLRTRGIRIKNQLATKPFGLPNFHVLDLDGNDLHFISRPVRASQTRWLGPAGEQNLVSYDYPFSDDVIRQTAERSRQALEEYAILDSLVPAAFHALTEFAANSFRTDRSLITLIDRDRQWFASHYGCPKWEMSLACSICAHVAAARMPIVIRDTRRDNRWRDHPAISDDFRFYAGVPLFSQDRIGIGAFCVADIRPRRFSAANLQALNSLAVIANCMIEKMRLYAKLQKLRFNASLESS
jgi:catechol 2,3-dioxygenase-like lactoylglutathione lyase family enzyme